MATTDKQLSIEGHWDPRFGPVVDRFAAMLSAPQERGAALCVAVGGQTLLDIWAGYADRHKQRPWQRDTLVNVFSCTKVFTAVIAMQLGEEGKLDLDVPMARYWPEFGVNGKEQITLRQVLSHRSGLSAIHRQLPTEAMYDEALMTQVMAEETPWWTPGQAHGYAPLTYGWLMAEPLRRIEGRAPRDSLISRITSPLGIDFQLGLDDKDFPRVADIIRAKGIEGDAASQRMLHAMLKEPDSVTCHAFTSPPGALTRCNDPQWRHLAQLAASGHGNARSLVAFYVALLKGSLLSDQALAEMVQEHSVGDDMCLRTATRLGLGCMLDQPDQANATYGAGPRAFGHPGVGGSCGFADPERDLAFGFVTNTIGPYVLMDPRMQDLARAVVACL